MISVHRQLEKYDDRFFDIVCNTVNDEWGSISAKSVKCSNAGHCQNNVQFLNIARARYQTQYAKLNDIVSKSLNSWYLHKLPELSILRYCLNWARILDIIINDDDVKRDDNSRWNMLNAEIVNKFNNINESWIKWTDSSISRRKQQNNQQMLGISSQKWNPPPPTRFAQFARARSYFGTKYRRASFFQLVVVLSRIVVIVELSLYLVPKPKPWFHRERRIFVYYLTR